jgi:hypothetical protein
MSESINANKTAKQFIVLDAASRRIENADKITRAIRVNNAEFELFKMTLYFKYQFFSNKRKVFMRKRLAAHSSAFNLSGGGINGGFLI